METKLTAIESWREFSLIIKSPNSPGYIFPRDLLLQVLNELFEMENALFEMEYAKYVYYSTNTNRDISGYPLCDIIKDNNLPLLRYVGKTKKSDLLKQNEYIKLMLIAINYGRFNIIVYLHEELGLTADANTLNHAAIQGRLKILTYLHEKMHITVTTNYILGYVAENRKPNGLKCLKYIHKKMGIIGDDYTMIQAIRYGNVDSVRYLHKIMHLAVYESYIKDAIRYKQPKIAAYIKSVLQN